MKAEFNATDLMQRIELECAITLTGVPAWRFRVLVGLWLIRLAARVMNVNVRMNATVPTEDMYKT